MSACTLPDEAISSPADGSLAQGGPIPLDTGAVVPLSEDVKSHLIGGTAALGAGVMIERGAGFLANILAARFAGGSTFGAYSLAISTANNISTYAAGGIGATAARFSGKYRLGSRGYSTLARSLVIVSVISALIAAGGLWLGAGPIAHLLEKPQLTGLLRWAAISAAGIILLECARGFFVGQRRLVAILLLSAVVGSGMLVLLPLGARIHSPVRMIVFQGGIAIAAVAICLLFSRPLKLHAPERTSESALPLAPMLREVWTFGGIQLSGVIGSNLAGWWLTTLVARSDSSLIQMSFFAIASQWRNLAGLAPGLLTEGSYAVMARGHEEAPATPHRVFALCSFASTAVASTLAAVGILVVPWVLRLLYGQTYRAAGTTVAIALAVAVVHMGNAPAAARLSIVSIRATGLINTVWAIFVAAAATLLLFKHGSAWQAMAIYFAAHVLSAFLVLLTLRLKDHVPPGLWVLFLVSSGGSALLAGLALWREFVPAREVTATAMMFSVLLVLASGLFLLGRHFCWMPSALVLKQVLSRVHDRFRRSQHV